MSQPDVDLERYELFEGPRYLFEVDRRDFLKSFGTGLLVLLVVSPDAVKAQQESGRGSGGDRMPSDVNAWLHIGEDGRVTVFTGKTEIGQNIRTSLTQAVGEELKVPLASITLVMADTGRTPFDQGTFGSRTTPTMNLQLRKVAAAAREVLAGRAAAQWNVARDAVQVRDGGVHGPAAQSIGFGELVKNGALVAAVNEQTALESPKDWTAAGTAAPKINARDFVTGRHQYTSDMTRDGMMHGRVVRPPSYGATLTRADTSAAQAIPGVVVVHDGNFLGVAAPSVADAARAAAAIKAEWTAGSGASDRTLFDDLRRTAAAAQGRGSGGAGSSSVDAALGSSPIKADAKYTIAYIAHAPLEPRAALAEWQDGRVTVWTGTQRPFGVQQELADAFHVAPSNVRVIVPDTGSAYGGKHTGDAAVEAARLARAAGKPVKLVWTREEEFAWAYFRPAGVIEVRAAAAKDGRLTAWEFTNYNSGPAGLPTPYDVAAKREEFHPSEYPLRQGSYRGLAATANHFARESHMDDLAHQAGMDPLAFRLKNLRDDRLVAVLQAAAKKFGWTAGAKGVGLACGVEKGGYTACCVELSAAPFRIRRVVVAFECGAIVNPNGLNNQVEGAIVQGLGGALFEAVAYEDGRLTNGHFAQYRVPRFSDTPPIDVVLLDRRDLSPAGAGETPIVGLAPAIGNALFSATGTRVRSLPLLRGGSLPTSHL